MKSKTIDKKYIGDAVYAEFDGYHVVLTTENGEFASNTIYLDSHVRYALFQFIRAVNQLETELEKEAA
jgi:hypothetical protein